MRPFRAALIAGALAGAALLSGRASAQDVTLTSRDGAVEVSGTLLGFDGTFYRIDSAYGELTVDGTGVLCDGPGCPNLDDFVADFAISGAETAGSVLLPALIEGFARREGYRIARRPPDAGRVVYELHGGTPERLQARFSIRSATTDEGFADVLANEADIVIALREIRDDEAARGIEAGLGDLRDPDRSRVLALDAVVPVVAPGNPLREISHRDLARVVTGSMSSWTGLGGEAVPIALHLPSADTGPGQAARNLLSPRPARAIADGGVAHRSLRQLTARVADDPFAIGLALASDHGAAVPLSLSGRCGFAIPATRLTAKTEDYPLVAPIFLYAPVRRLPQVAREFLAYTHGPAAQIVIRRAGFTDQALEEIPIAVQGDRFANAIAQAEDAAALSELRRMVSVLRPMTRLTPTFRFHAGSAGLDAQSRTNVRRLATALETGRFDGRKLVLIGFSDGRGSAAANRRIGQRRAEGVRRAVLAAAETADFDRVTIEVESFGAAMPMACDDSRWGRHANRRVEVWLR